MMTQLFSTDEASTLPSGLTLGQRLAATELGASECLGTGRPDGAVFLYASRRGQTDRVLVDRRGAVLDRTVLHHR